MGKRLLLQENFIFKKRENYASGANIK